MPGKTYSPGRMLGMNNRLPSSRLDASVDRARATYLSAADNVDLQANGFVRRRRGYALALAGGLCHSFWADGPEGFYMDGGSLVRVLPDLSTQVLRSDLAPQLRMSFTRLPAGEVAYTNGAVLGRIASGVLGRIVADPLSVTPTITPTVGSLPAGKYLVCFTSLTADGESAATPVEQIDLPAGSGIAITGLAPGVQTYMSAANGDVLTLTDGSNPIVVQPAAGAPRCATVGLASMPAGQIVRYYNGSLLVAAGSLLYISEPYYRGLYRPGRSFIPFPERITIVEPCVGGVFVCADQAYWLAGNLLSTSLNPVLPFGGIAGSGARSEDGNQVFWQSRNGIVVGAADGSVSTPQHAALVFGEADSGASLYRRQDGVTHVVGTRSGTGPSVGAGSSWMDAEVIRKGTVL